MKKAYDLAISMLRLPRDRAVGLARMLSWKGALWGLLLLVVLVVTLRETFRSVTLVDPFAVPRSLTDQGYTPQVVANQVVDEIHRIYLDVHTRAAKGRVGLSSEDTLPDAEVPETKISLRAMIQFLRGFLHREPFQVTGEIISPSAGSDLQVTFRIIRGSERVAVRQFSSSAGVDEVIRRSARLILGEINPYILATYLYQVDHDGAQAFQLIAPCIRDEECTTRAWGFNFWGNILADQGMPEEAIQKYRKAIALDRGMALPHANWGRVLDAQGKENDAIAQYRQAIQLDPKLALAYNNWGLILERRRDYSGAIAKYHKAILVDRFFAGAYVNLGNILSAQKDLSRAEENYRIAIDREPRSTDAHAALGNLLLARGDQQQAIAEYQKAIILDPKFPAAYNGLGNVLYLRQDLDGAAAIYRKLLELDPKSPVANANLGNVLYQQRTLARSSTSNRRATGLGIP